MNNYLIKEKCGDCDGTGVVFVETTSFLGLVRKHQPVSCSACGGKGHRLTQPQCKYCDGRGLIGEERAVCRVCNGTGYGDQFRWIPRSQLQPDRAFERSCMVCRRRTVHEITTPIQAKVEVVSWEEEEALRQKRTVERVKVACTECGDAYWIEIDPDFHPELSELSDEEQRSLEENFLIRG